MSPLELQGILDAIKAMNDGQYIARGEYVTETPRMSKHDPTRQAFDFEADGETKNYLYDYSEPKPYEHKFSENEMMQILKDFIYLEFVK